MDRTCLVRTGVLREWPEIPFPSHDSRPSNLLSGDLRPSKVHQTLVSAIAMGPFSTRFGIPAPNPSSHTNRSVGSEHAPVSRHFGARSHCVLWERSPFSI